MSDNNLDHETDIDDTQNEMSVETVDREIEINQKRSDQNIDHKTDNACKKKVRQQSG